MNNLVETLRRLIFRQHEDTPGDILSGDQQLAIDTESVQTLMQLLETTEEGQYSCEETFELLDEYVDLEIDDHQAETIMPLVKGHLDCCPDCRERYETLITILKTP